jgi:hypothetical protein
MNWLERARREIQQYTRQPTANSAERIAMAVMAVPLPCRREELQASIGSNGSAAPAGRTLNIEAVREEFGADRQAIRIHEPELTRRLFLDRIEATWTPGEWLAYHDGAQLLTAKYAGTSTLGRVNVWLADGALRAIPPEAVALDWRPDAAEIFEERLAIMLEAGVPEDMAGVRAERCTREYLARLSAGAACATLG